MARNKRPWVWAKYWQVPYSPSELEFYGDKDPLMNSEAWFDSDKDGHADFLSAYRRELYARWKAMNE